MWIALSLTYGAWWRSKCFFNKYLYCWYAVFIHCFQFIWGVRTGNSIQVWPLYLSTWYESVIQVQFFLLQHDPMDKMFLSRYYFEQVRCDLIHNYCVEYFVFYLNGVWHSQSKLNICQRFPSSSEIWPFQMILPSQKIVGRCRSLTV